MLMAQIMCLSQHKARRLSPYSDRKRGLAENDDVAATLKLCIK